MSQSFSRALRYYYDKNIIKKVLGQKFVYKFVSPPDGKIDNGKLALNMSKMNAYHSYMTPGFTQTYHHAAELKDPIFNGFPRHPLQNNYPPEPNNNSIFVQSMEPTDLSFKTGKNPSKKRPNAETDNESVSSDGAWTESSDNGSTSLSVNSHQNGANKRPKTTTPYRSLLSPLSMQSTSPSPSNRSATSSPVTAESYSNLSNDCSPVNLSQSATGSERESEKSGLSGGSTSSTGKSAESKSKSDSSSGSSSSSSSSTGTTKSKPKPPPICAVPSSPTRNPSFAPSLQTPIVTYMSPFFSKHTPAMLSNYTVATSSLSPLLFSPRFGGANHFQFPAHIGTLPPTPPSMMPPLSPFAGTSFSPFYDPQFILSPQSTSIPVLQS